MPSAQVLLAAIAAILASVLVHALVPPVYGFYRGSKSPLRDLRGLRSLGWLSGSVTGIWELDAAEFFENIIPEYGPTLKYYSYFNMYKLLTVDLKAINHILNHSMEFYRSNEVRYSLEEILGNGLLVVEGQHHKQQPRIFNPAFGLPQLRELTSIFVDKSIELRDILTTQIVCNPVREDKYAVVDIFGWLSKASLDMIGLAGFDYPFHSLQAGDKRPNELYEAIRTMMSAESFSLSFLVPLMFPPARYIPTARSRIMAKCLATIRRIGTQIVSEKKAAVLAGLGPQEKGLERQNFASRDLIIWLIKANLAVDLPESARLSDEDIVSQIPTFVVAGHETISALLAWTLYHLCINTKAQDKLRAEVTALPTDTPTMDELNALHYLDLVVRESLRVDSPVSSSERVATEDCVVPVDNEYIDRHGRVRREIRVNKGDAIFIAVREINKSKELWGKDAAEFIPERWEHPPESSKNIPGTYNNVLSFLSGPHGCIGYRFAIVECVVRPSIPLIHAFDQCRRAKAILFTLIRSFEFALALPKEDITRKTRVVGRPHVAREMFKGPQMPLLIRPVSSG